MKNYQLHKTVFQVAHIIKSAFETFGEALKAAWKIAKMNFGRTVTVKFVKSNGEIRTATAKGTGNLETIKKGFVRFIELLNDGSTQYRSFRIEKLILD